LFTVGGNIETDGMLMANTEYWRYRHFCLYYG